MVVLCTGFILYKPDEKEHDHVKYGAIVSKKKACQI